MKILHIISSGGMYGAEAVILNISRSLNEGPHQSILGVFSNTAQPNLQLHERALQEGIQSHLISCNGQVDRSVPTRIRELVHQTGANVVHAHGYKADVYAYLAMKRSPTPLVATSHGWIDNDLAMRLYGALDRFVLKNYAAVVAVSEEVKQRLLTAGVRKDRVHLIWNGIDLRPFIGPERPHQDQSGKNCALNVGLAGRLSPEKGIDLFLRAAANVLRELPLTQFLIAGDGPDRATLEALIHELGIEKNAFLLGRNDDMPSFYASLDLLVSSSRQEGLPMALLEGMASGVPLVATAVGAVPNVVHNNQTGILLPAEDVKALTAAIVKLLSEPASRKTYGTAARDLIRSEYSAERMMAEYLHLYHQAAQKTRG
jgi:glycosyltransferase involved in cell wall biosynthesis